ncbi:MAG: arginyltransferase [Spirochaetes bacterium]|nr:arginyltransferase [Spirochaetota bacterium]
MELVCYEHDNGDCPYIKDNRWISLGFFSDQFGEQDYENLINHGFRRCGTSFYKNICPNCQACIPIRIPVNKFLISRSQKRILKKNQDVQVVTKPVEFKIEDFILYQHYCQVKHNKEKTPELEDYYLFLIESPVNTQMMKYYLDDKLIGIGLIDLLYHSISSVYYAFDPQYAKRSLGVFSVLEEINLCKRLNKDYLQLGFWVNHSQKMSYKNQYRPYQLLIDQQWVEFTE